MAKGQYVKCSEAEVPSRVRFDVFGGHNRAEHGYSGSLKSVIEVSFGGFSRVENGYGAPFKRVFDRSLGRDGVTYFRWVPAKAPMHATVCALLTAALLGLATAGTASADDTLTYARKNYATMQWFVRHCRPLSRLEMTVRKIDDPDAFVCDSAAGRKPARLTPAYVRAWQGRGLELPDEVSSLNEYLATVEVSQ